MKKKSEQLLDLSIMSILISIFTIILVIITGSIYYFYKDSDTLLAGIIAFIGAVLGGAITLIGVKFSLEGSFSGIELSLEHQKNEKIKETIGIKLNKLYQVKKIVYQLDHMLSSRKYGWNEKNEKDNLENINGAIYKFILPKLNDLLEISASVDWEFFSKIKSFVESARPLLISFEDSDLDELTEIVDELTEKIETDHESRLSNIFEQASTKQLLNNK